MRKRLLAAIAAGAVLLVIVPLAVAAPPDPTIGAVPSGTIADTTPTFTFSSAGATGFTCSIAGPTAVGATACNGGSFTSPTLSDGAYVFSVTATDGVDTSGASTRGFTVDTTPPAPPPPTINSGPSGTTTDTTPAFGFSSAGATGYTCSIAGPTTVGATACNGGSFTSPTLSQGSYTFSVTASNAGGTSGPATRGFTVDTPPATPTINTGPTGTIVDPTPTFTFSSAGATGYTCSIAGPTTVGATACNGGSFTSPTLTQGAYTFSVTASDGGGTSAAATRAFTLDTPPATPTIGSGPSGAINDPTPTFGFSSAGATGYTCSIAGPTAVGATACNGGSFTAPSLGDGAYTFSVTASDGGGTSAAATRAFTVDTTPPSTSITTSVPATINTTTLSIAFTATGAPASFACSVDGGGFAACTSPRGLTGLADGAHTFAVRATDAVGNVDPSPATVTFTVDATPPELTVPENRTVEADGPGGTNVSYSVSASDGGLALLPGAVDCKPGSPEVFGLGKSTVTCTATDAVGNKATKSFDITVVDTTPPAINAPDASFTATDASGVARSDKDVAAYLAGIKASDLVSGVTLTTNTPDKLPIGATKIIVKARDAAGNQSQKTVTLTVLEPGKKAPKPDFTPPGPVRGLSAKPVDGAVLLTWTAPAASDLAYVRIERSIVGGPSSSTKIVYRGLGTRFKSTGLRNGVSYRFILVAFDKSNNSSKGVVVSASPKALLLAAPKPGAKVAKAPLLRWAVVDSASYYNVQLYRKGTKILSAWPKVVRLKLTSRWSYEKRKYTLKPGVYTWYVWPGVGPRANVRYGDLLGKSSFVVVATKNPLAKKT